MVIYPRNFRRIVMIVMVALMCVSCVARYKVIKEAPSRAKPVAEYKSLYVGWLNLRESDYAKYGYYSKEHWKKSIYGHNVDGLQVQMREMFPDKTLYFAGPNDSQFPQKGDLYIKFDVHHIDENFNLVGGHDHLVTDVSFFDVRTRELLYTSTVDTSSFGYGPKAWAFEARLGMAINNLCSFIHDKLSAQ